MKKAGLLLLMLATVCFQGLAQTAKIKSCSIAPDNDDDMLTVKVSFDISGCQGEEGRVNVYFYNKQCHWKGVEVLRSHLQHHRQLRGDMGNDYS